MTGPRIEGRNALATAWAGLVNFFGSWARDTYSDMETVLNLLDNVSTKF